MNIAQQTKAIRDSSQGHTCNASKRGGVPAVRSFSNNRMQSRATFWRLYENLKPLNRGYTSYKRLGLRFSLYRCAIHLQMI